MQLRVLLLQLPVPNNPATNVPLAAGYLKAYAYAQEGGEAPPLRERVTIDILPRALADHAGDAALVEAIVARAPHVLGLSLYTWNSERSLDIARRARERLPSLLVVAGGPEIQRDNEWVLRHPALDIGVIGEGEQTFAELLQIVDCRLQIEPARLQSTICNLQSVPGLAFRDEHGGLVFTPERVPLANLAALPSPYLLGYLEIDPDAMLMVEVSRWCPYSCSFCLYGRNMGSRLGSRYFGLERLLAEIRWGMERGASRVHFIEANLNLVPVFQSLMRALAEINADGRLALYAELRGEHLTEEAVAALARAGLRVAEVGLQTANPAALRATHRKTDLRKWADGTRRLYAHGVEVLLDVILGLPADDAAGVAATLDFIRRERLGPYDAFTLQALPGVEVRRQAAEYGLVYQDRPPYYVLATDRLSYGQLRALRRELKVGAGLDPDAVEGCPEPRVDALGNPKCKVQNEADSEELMHRVVIDTLDDDELAQVGLRLANHVDMIATWDQGPQACCILHFALTQNPSSLIDLYFLCENPPSPHDLRALRERLPFQPGYLDRVAVYRREAPAPPYERVSPRLFLVLPWTAQADPREYAGSAEIVWEYRVAPGEEPPFAAWEAAGGAGIWVRGAPPEMVATWRTQTPTRLWHD
jgi:radical SAM superfamily enzyme YgiQ (UPF0313 family)